MDKEYIKVWINNIANAVLLLITGVGITIFEMRNGVTLFLKFLLIGNLFIFFVVCIFLYYLHSLYRNGKSA
jgi:hypothetical protein